MNRIRFGTDGWRGRIADDFTFANVRKVAGAAASWIRDQGTADRPVVVGYDTRFLSSEFAAAAAARLAGEGLDVVLSDAVCTTPALSFATRRRHAALGLMVTASHNPYTDNGIKLKGPYGGPIYGDTIAQIQERCLDANEAGPDGACAATDLMTPYGEAVAGYADMDRIRDLDLRIVIDAMGGAAGRTLEDLLAGGRLDVSSIRTAPDPLFGGGSPEPAPILLDDLASRLRAGRADLGFATDGDGDRIAVLDDRGEFVQLHDLVPLLVEHLVVRRGMTGRVVRSVALHDTVDRIAADLGIEAAETPVGFRHLCEQMVAGGVMLAAEESGGMGFAFHVPERDGIVSALMILDMIAAAGRGLPELVGGLRRRYGPLSYRRIDRSEEGPIGKWRLREVYDDAPWASGDGPRVVRSAWVDGVKLFFEGGGWLLIRVSETEPLTRFYAAAGDAATVATILDRGAAWVDAVLRGASGDAAR